MNLKKSCVFNYFLASLLIVSVLSSITFPFFVKAYQLHSYLGPDTNSDGFTLSDLSVEGPSEVSQGSRLTFFFTLMNSPDNPPMTFTSKGIFVAAIDPGGNDRSFGFMYPGETIQSGQSLIFYGEYTPTVAGAWKFWPSYEVQIGETETKRGPQEWHAYYPYVIARDMPDLTPLSLSLTPTLPRAGEEARISLISKNIGSASSGECYGALFIGNSLWTSFRIPFLGPGERTETVLDWFPMEQDTWEIGLYLDYWDSIQEIDENNNLLELSIENTFAEISPLEIVAGPRVVNITQNSAIVEWETNEGSTSGIDYGEIAGYYSQEIMDDLITLPHRIMLTDLRPSSTYHYSVHSQGLIEDTVRSNDKTFVTLPIPDDVRPSLTLVHPDSYRGIVEVSADAWDNVGVERTEFYLDDVLVFTDYSPPFVFSVDTSVYENGVHTLEVVAKDYSGQSMTETRPIEIINVEDKDAPKVELTSPTQDEELEGVVQVTATLSDDVGLAYAFFKVEGQSEGFKGLPSNPKTTSVTFDWDTTTIENGEYRIGIEAFDKELEYGVGVVDVKVNNPPVLLPPKLKIIGHTVIRQDNHFYISLTIKNTGDLEASDIVISDYLRSFQPISGSDTIAEYRARYKPSENLGDVTVESKVDISPGWSHTYTYEAVPILFRGLQFVSDPYDSSFPSIGNPTKICYNGPDGSKYHDEFQLPVLKTLGGESIPSSYSSAIKSADYLILTDAHRLFSHNNDQEVNDLLSTMATLARYRKGVLGYSSFGDYGHKQVIHDLIKHGGEWSSKLKSGWSSNGYLLLVGETEIIPTWTRNLGTYETTKGDYTWNVLTDLPYANTYGDERNPELSIGRIIGNNARELRKVIENSLNVLLKTPGHEFDRTHAFLISGFPDEIMGDFKGQRDAVSAILSKTSPGTSILMINAPDYAQYDSSGKIDDKLTEAAVEYIFFSSIKGKDIIFLAGHGNWNHWNEVHNSDVLGQADPFGWTNSFVFASSCKTGYYFSGYGLAESFLQRGAAVYLGATESGGWTPYSKKFFEFWDQDEPISLAVKQVKKSLGNDLKDRIWSYAYHVYGDAKFGAANSLVSTVFYTTSVRSEAPSNIDVRIPGYEVRRIDEEDHVEIPGGFEFFEMGMPLVPSYKVSYSYPKGYQIQDVLQVHKSEPINVTGLNILNSVLTLPASYTEVSTQSSSFDWWPDKDFEWAVYQNPENSTLLITVYPFFYNPQTSEARFYRDHEFFVNYTISPVEITGISTDKYDYDVGEQVEIDLDLSNEQSTGKDVVINSIIKDENTGDVVSGLNLRTLNDVNGKASYSVIWDGINIDRGNYDIVVELRDTKGVLLDKKIKRIRLGSSQGEITGFILEPESPQTGDTIRINMVFDNSGKWEISGTAKIKLLNSTGHLNDESEKTFTDLPPSESIEFTYEWNTSNAEDSAYKIVGYVLYEGETTTPVIEHVYLPSFELYNLSITPDKAEPGESIIVTVECKNVGSKTGSHAITLKINGIITEEETITLNPDEVSSVTFDVAANQEGIFAVDINELSGSFAVEKARTGIPGFSYETIVIGLILALLFWLALPARAL